MTTFNSKPRWAKPQLRNWNYWAGLGDSVLPPSPDGDKGSGRERLGRDRGVRFSAWDLTLH